MEKPLLTIALPTYNRPVQLRRCLEALAPQINEQCVFRIYDNHSTEPVEDIAKPILEKYNAPNWHITRRPFNIGGPANIMHSYENVDTPWVWVLGDDDIPLPDAVSRVLDLIEKHPQTLAFGFEWDFADDPAGPADQGDSVLATPDELLASRALRSISLISSCVYNASAIHSVFCLGYQYSSSFFPHLAWLVKCLQNDQSRPVRYSMTPLVTFVADGMYDAPGITAFVLPNIRYLSRMMETAVGRAAVMRSTFAKTFVGSPNKRFQKPSFATIVAAAAFGGFEQSRGVLYRARRVVGEALEFDEADRLIPLSGFYGALRLVLGIAVGALLGPLVRLAYRIKSGGSCDCPTLVRGFKYFHTP